MNFKQWLEHDSNVGRKSVEPIKTPDAKVHPAMREIPTPVKRRLIKLSDWANKIHDPIWHMLYKIFARNYSKNPDGFNVSSMGLDLYTAASTGDMSVLKPLRSKYLNQGS